MASGQLERTVVFEGRRLTYVDAGTGPAVVLIHGLGGSNRWWARNVSVLAGSFRVIALDLPGFGGSAGRAFAPVEAATFLSRWLSQIGVERASVIGHSLGGLVALELAAEHHEMIERVVLVDGAVFAPGMRPARYALNLVRQGRYAPLGFVPLLAHDTWRAGPRSLLFGAASLFRSEVRAKLSRVVQPSLLIWGEHDVVVPLAVGQELLTLLPNARLEVLPGAGHNPMWDRPEVFNALVRTFLSLPLPVPGDLAGPPSSVSG